MKFILKKFILMKFILKKFILMKFILKNIHTIILLIGIGLFMYGLFSISQTVGYIGSGVLAIMLATYIDRSAR